MMRVSNREDEEGIELRPLIENYCADVDREFTARLDAWPPDFAQIHVHEVIGGMLAREATLAKDLARAPMLWTGHSAPILLRAMADAYINLTWLLLDPVERCRKFIFFGLGQAKLELEHRRAQIGTREPTPQEVAMLEARERWIDSQRISGLLDVDLGKWSSISVRQMAEEAGCIDFYNYIYTPFSACAHSMWHHVAHYDLRECGNPLHRYHRRPTSETSAPDLYYLTLAAKYWSKTLGTFDRAYGLAISGPSSYETLIDAITDDPQPD
ncbi:hypothetical protein FJ417_26680 [Mesorhizobium sp. B3-1-7]|uniref:DUF5677 domain-containing protein n=1 Tax=Mesorhizobium sp. B3-1-7 TaxID=2589894 RepID=UPI00112E2E98|nr:DUF5677 domain-containing protein [Mesorhizobium sp. B3-1-7]TPI52751.1 hypothetical protein FJ417_26680 [Mesorhizobium sp. B3-1-7]